MSSSDLLAKYPLLATQANPPGNPSQEPSEFSGDHSPGWQVLASPGSSLRPHPERLRPETENSGVSATREIMELCRGQGTLGNQNLSCEVLR